MSTYEKLQQFDEHIYNKHLDPAYDGDYSITLTAEGRSISLAMNSFAIDLIEDDQILIHLNVIDIHD